MRVYISNLNTKNEHCFFNLRNETGIKLHGQIYPSALQPEVLINACAKNAFCGLVTVSHKQPYSVSRCSAWVGRRHVYRVSSFYVLCAASNRVARAGVVVVMNGGLLSACHRIRSQRQRRVVSQVNSTTITYVLRISAPRRLAMEVCEAPLNNELAAQIPLNKPWPLKRRRLRDNIGEQVDVYSVRKKREFIIALIYVSDFRSKFDLHR